MLILGIDTSDGVSVALVRDHAVLARADGADPRRHAETLAPGIEWVLGEAGVDRRDLDAVAVGTGPAPFTGLRVGLVTARTLARALDIPARGVCSLDALARQAFDTLGPDGPDTVLAVADARRREVYAALYHRGTAPLDDVDRTAGPVVARAADVVDALGHDAPDHLRASRDLGAQRATAAIAVVGRGAQLHPESLPPTPGGPSAVDAAVLARLAEWRAARGGEADLEPRYLRRPDVTPAPARKRVS